MERSTIYSLGPMIVLRPALPNVPRAGAAKAAVLNQLEASRRAPAIGEPTTFGRSLSSPVPLTSMLINGVIGNPLDAVYIPLSCQPSVNRFGKPPRKEA